MFEFLFDAPNLQLDYTLYVGFLLGLTVKFFLVWKIEFNIFDSVYTSSDMHIEAKSLALQMKRQMPTNKRLMWIVKYIRRKESTGDEPDHPISSILYL